MKRSEFTTPVKTAVSGTHTGFWSGSTDAVAHVETWYDKHSRNYITTMLDADGQQIDDADFTGNRFDAHFAHTTAVNAINGSN